jgi:ergothioneine biosynthesis protein EgtB
LRSNQTTARKQGTEAPDFALVPLRDRYKSVRGVSMRIARPLQAEDLVVQSMPDVSPMKWHLAHTSWFFEQFLLGPGYPGYEIYDPNYGYLFNSYYETVGARHARAERGLLTRPTVAEVMKYRQHVDGFMLRLLEDPDAVQKCCALIELGLNHEQQHQELMLTDIKHVLSCNPLQPAYREDLPGQARTITATDTDWIAFEGGLQEIGADPAGGFCFDNESPRHRTWTEPYELASRPIINREFMEFIRDGGYDDARHWLSDGWAVVQHGGWQRPLYWSEDLQSEFTLGGLCDLDPSAPVCHVSFYEADAYARWAGARLPGEVEWELAAGELPLSGNLLESDRLQPVAAVHAPGLNQLFGDVWEWTASPYGPYPGFRPAAGAVGEYNGKFMCNQLVLRGGSCATPASHVRASYRNFFYPNSRWQFMGLRLARDAGR